MLEIEQTLATVHALLRSDGLMEAAAIVRTCAAQAEQTGHDNWNGGTDIWEVRFNLSVPEYASLGAKRAQLEDQITARLKIVLEPDTQDWYTAKIVPAKQRQADWRLDTATLARQIRINIFDGLRLEEVA
ncbi:MAG: hypothetical protein KGJ30_17460, partial [Burkholderiales bacterium]|nr:hypothetical protein [Burkholderiales bacterium]